MAAIDEKCGSLCLKFSCPKQSISVSQLKEFGQILKKPSM